MNTSLQSWFATGYQSILTSPVAHWLETLPKQLSEWSTQSRHGHLDKWCRLLAKLPTLESTDIDVAHAVRVGQAEDIEAYTQKQIEGLLRQFMPWRKGPFSIYGIDIDTEWRSDWKWDRVAAHIDDLNGRTVLDVGCGSGYHLWRMQGAGAKHVYGIDPTQLFLIQFQAIKHFIGESDVHLFPLGIEQMQPLEAFDTVFSMGVLYHRRDPIEFLNQLKLQLRKGGQLVLETLVVEGDVNTVFMPTDRYAQMPNVWFLPSTEALCHWLQKLGFVDCKVVDVNQTSLEEQRTTDWMPNHSLADYLDPADHNKTIEGYPAPVRATIVAYRG